MTSGQADRESRTPAIDRTLLDRIDALEAENADLRDSLKQAVESKGSSEVLGSSPERLRQKYDQLSKNYRNLQDKHGKCELHIKRANDKYHAAKETVKQWKDFIDRQHEKAAKLSDATAGACRASSPAPGPGNEERTPRPLRARLSMRQSPSPGKARDAPCLATDGGEKAALKVHDPMDVEGKRLSGGSGESLGSRAHRVTSSQTTEDGPESPEPHSSRLSSNDEPEFVSARSVKRRRGNSPREERVHTQVKREPPSQPFEILSDDFSSPVLKKRQLVRTDTSNLDAIVRSVDSPKRRREQRAVSAEIARPPRMLTTVSSLSEGDPSDSHQPPIKEESERSANANIREGALLPREGSDASDRALQSLSANIARPVPPSTTKRERRDEDLKIKAALLSEGGDFESSQVHPQERKETPKTAAASGRLDSLLAAEPTPERHQIRRKPPNTIAPRRRENVDTPDGLTRRAEKRSAAYQTPPTARPTFKKPHMPPKPSPTKSAGRTRPIERSPEPPEPEDEPLRSRPPNRLSIDDFRINPAYKGTDFAFADTLRGRDQRRCLPGCTRPECCGDTFRKAAEMGTHTKQSDDKALAAYLGPNFKQHMASRPQAEQDEMLIKARTHAMASEHGKHRQAFKRRTTPPGFWRVDMPSTQEEEQDRVKAHEMMRQEVYERWREAMTTGGRWKFRDE